MARPNSRYFTPVIRKILDAKKHEKIIIDASFKAELRAAVMVKAGGVHAPAGEKALERKQVMREREMVMREPVMRVRETLNWDKISEFFRKWRYQLAIVPSALLLVLVAVQASKLPVFMKSSVLVPTVQTQMEAKTDGGLQATGEPEAVVEPQVLKTFPGRSVMPSKYFQTTDVMTEMPVIVPMPVTDADISISNVQAPYAVKTVVTQSPAAQPQVLQPVTSLIYNKEVPQGTKAGDVAQGTEAGDVLQSSEAGDVPGTEAGDVPQAAQAVNPENPAPAAPIVLTPVSQSQPQSGQNMQQTLPATQPMMMTQSAPPVTQAPPPTQVMPIIQAPPIYYYVDLADKGIFEAEILGPFMAGKNVSYVTVSTNEDRLTVVTLYLQDGTSETAYFQKSGADGRWYRVNYVTNYFYDDGLQYSSVPGIYYVPLQNPDGNHYIY